MIVSWNQLHRSKPILQQQLQRVIRNKISVWILLFRFQKILDHFSSVRSYFADSLENAHTIYDRWAPRARFKCIPSQEFSSQISQVTFFYYLTKVNWLVANFFNQLFRIEWSVNTRSAIVCINKSRKKVSEYKIYNCHCGMTRTPWETHRLCIPCEHLQWPSSQIPAKSALRGSGE